MKCCLCKKEAGKWGHNAQPLKDGRCCNDCNSNKVIPTRLNIMRKVILEENSRKLKNYSYGNNKLGLDIGENGFTLWLNGRWCLDASMINSNGHIYLDKERLKLIKSDIKRCKLFKLKSKRLLK